MEGWIKIHRRILDWEWFTEPNTMLVFLYLLLTARREAGCWRGIELQPGQCVVGRAKISVDTGISERKVRASLEHLETAKVVTIESTNRYSIITICNYTKYQGTSERSEVTRMANSDERLERFRKRYLSYDTNHKISQPEKSYRRLLNQKNINWDKVKEYIAKEIPYHDFLSTLYWKVISAYVKHINSFRCSNCGRGDNLHVHHLHYLNHGDELHNLDDLVCLCAECHEKEHNKK